MLPKGIKHVKATRAGGKVYLYYVTSRVNSKGKAILVRLPDLDDPSFWQTYAGFESARARQAADLLTVPALVRMFYLSPKWAKLAPKSQKSYTSYLEKLADNFRTAPAGKMDRQDILKVSEAMAPTAANVFVSAVASMYRWGRQRGHVENDPCRDIEKNEVGEHEPWPIELIEQALKSDDPVIRLSVHLLYYTAQRIGDVCRMRWTDISANDPREIHVIQEKTDTELFIRLHRSLIIELDRQPKSFDTIMVGPNDKPWKPDTLRMRLQRWAQDRDHKIVPHGLRKNAVNALLEAGCTTAQTSAISGQSLKLVEHYARRRNRTKLGSAAILNWERDQNRNVQKNGKTARKRQK